MKYINYLIVKVLTLFSHFPYLLDPAVLRDDKKIEICEKINFFFYRNTAVPCSYKFRIPTNLLIICKPGWI